MIIYCDGGCRGNGTKNPYCYGSYKVDNEAPVMLEFLTLKTNNQAEYQIFCVALFEQAARSDRMNEEIIMKIDSALVYYQIKGEWKCKSDSLIFFHKQAQELYRKVNARLELVSGEEMKRVLEH